jgi:transcriptional regulator with XRE-family HTH domain
MPRKPKFVHPLRAVRAAINKSQPEFAKMFGVSASYIQAIELGQRNISSELADDIMLRFGVEAESLKRKRFLPVSLLRQDKIDIENSSSSATKKLGQEFAALQEITDPRERLQFCIEFYRKIFPGFESGIPYQEFPRKLGILIEAAVREKKHLPLLIRLDRWMENAAKKFRLETTMKVVAGNRSDWKPFREMIWQSLPFLPPQKKNQLPRPRRKKR